MGNTVGTGRQGVDEKFTRPQRLHKHCRDDDLKKLRKLILDSKLAPCYPGDEESALDHEECPICFLYYPSLNRSRCCIKGICTECYLQVKPPPNSTRPNRCPFCNNPDYAVEYRGARTKEEREMEQLEEQRVIEATLRMLHQEVQDEEERTHQGQELTSPAEAGNRDISMPSSQDLNSMPASRTPSYSRQNRENEIDSEEEEEEEEIMLELAIWLSIQEQGGGSGLPGPSTAQDRYKSRPMAPLKGSPSGGLACVIATVAEHQHMNGDSANVVVATAPVFTI